MMDWIRRLLGGSDSEMNFGSMDAGAPGLLNPSSEGLNFAQPPAEMTEGWKYDPSQIPAQGLVAESPDPQIRDRSLLQIILEKANQDRRKGKEETPYDYMAAQTAFNSQNRVPTPQATDMMQYVTRTPKQRRAREPARVNSYEYLKGLLG